MLRRTLVLAFLLIPAAAAQATAPMNPGGWGQLAASVPAMVGAAGVVVSPDGALVLVAGGTDAFTFYGHGEGFGGLSVLNRDAATGALTKAQCISSDGSRCRERELRSRHRTERRQCGRGVA